MKDWKELLKSLTLNLVGFHSSTLVEFYSFALYECKILRQKKCSKWHFLQNCRIHENTKIEIFFTIQLFFKIWIWQKKTFSKLLPYFSLKGLEGQKLSGLIFVSQGKTFFFLRLGKLHFKSATNIWSIGPTARCISRKKIVSVSMNWTNFCF